jgi:hypothetical protein
LEIKLLEGENLILEDAGLSQNLVLTNMQIIFVSAACPKNHAERVLNLAWFWKGKAS